MMLEHLIYATRDGEEVLIPTCENRFGDPGISSKRTSQIPFQEPFTYTLPQTFAAVVSISPNTSQTSHEFPTFLRFHHTVLTECMATSL